MSDRDLNQDELDVIVDRYVAVWNEPDADRRRRGVADLWTEDGVHLAQTIEARGRNEIITRVGEAYEEFVVQGGFVFCSAGDAAGHHGVAKFRWEMVPTGGGPVAAIGLDVFVLDGVGRIRAAYQFLEPTP